MLYRQYTIFFVLKGLIDAKIIMVKDAVRIKPANKKGLFLDPETITIKQGDSTAKLFDRIVLKGPVNMGSLPYNRLFNKTGQIGIDPSRTKLQVADSFTDPNIETNFSFLLVGMDGLFRILLNDLCLMYDEKNVLFSQCPEEGEKMNEVSKYDWCIEPSPRFEDLEKCKMTLKKAEMMGVDIKGIPGNKNTDKIKDSEYYTDSDDNTLRKDNNMNRNPKTENKNTTKDSEKRDLDNVKPNDVKSSTIEDQRKRYRKDQLNEPGMAKNNIGDDKSNRYDQNPNAVDSKKNNMESDANRPKNDINENQRQNTDRSKSPNYNGKSDNTERNIPDNQIGKNMQKDNKIPNNTVNEDSDFFPTARDNKNIREREMIEPKDVSNRERNNVPFDRDNNRKSLRESENDERPRNNRIENEKRSPYDDGKDIQYREDNKDKEGIQNYNRNKDTTQPSYYGNSDRIPNYDNRKGNNSYDGEKIPSNYDLNQRPPNNNSSQNLPLRSRPNDSLYNNVDQGDGYYDTKKDPNYRNQPNENNRPYNDLNQNYLTNNSEKPYYSNNLNTNNEKFPKRGYEKNIDDYKRNNRENLGPSNENDKLYRDNNKNKQSPDLDEQTVSALLDRLEASKKENTNGGIEDISTIEFLLDAVKEFKSKS